MAINLNDLAGALMGAQEQPAAPRASRDQYGTIALDAQGTPTVMLDGGTDYAPCTCMVGVHHGDRVLAHVVNHKIVVFANITAPTTDDATALVAIDRADAAAEAADAAGIAAASAQADAAQARTDAATAKTAAQGAVADAAAAEAAAEAVEELAEQASEDAAAASTAASNAITAANKAAYALSDVEKVVGTVNWIAEHGSYELTEDTAIVPGKVYYTRTGTAPDYTYEVVANPEASGLATYYELELDESVQNFLASHLWLDNYGLNLSVDSANGYRIHQGTVDGTKAVGTYILNPDGEQMLALTASGEVIGKPYVPGATDNESHMELDYHSMQMVDMDGETYFHVSDLRESDGAATLTETFDGDGTTKKFTVAFAVSDEVSATDSSNVGNTATRSYREYTFASAPASGAIVTIIYKTESANAKAFTFGARDTGNIGPLSFVAGTKIVASGSHSVAMGYRAQAEGMTSVAMGYGAHTKDAHSVAIGYHTYAKGPQSTALGSETQARSYASTAMGYLTRAIGGSSTAMGRGTQAVGAGSVASGYYTVANGHDSTVVGKFNVDDSQTDSFTGDGNTTVFTLTKEPGTILDLTIDGTDTGAYRRSGRVITFKTAPASGAAIEIKYTFDLYALIIGNGTADDARSNAAVIDWLGNYIAQGWAGITQMFAGAVTQTVDSDGVATATGAPRGWLLCDGSAVSRTEYATLYSAIGDTWGAGDGSTTFNLPDLRGRAPIGAGTGTGLSARTLGGTVGAETVTLTVDEIPAHTHTVTYANYNRATGNAAASAVDYSSSSKQSGSTGGGQAHNNMQPSAVVNFIIHTGKTS